MQFVCLPPCSQTVIDKNYSFFTLLKWFVMYEMVVKYRKLQENRLSLFRLFVLSGIVQSKESATEMICDGLKHL